VIYEEIASKVLNRIPPKAAKSIPARSTLYDSLDRAKKALAAQTMTAEDARAWLDLDDMQCELLRQP
jgi:hypothetical protein